MIATQQLKDEHQAVLLVLSILEKICQKLKSGKEIDPKHLEQALEFIQVFVDKCHHSKEEDMLFPALEKIGIPKEGGPIGVMLDEHDQGRRYIKELSAAVEKFGGGDKKEISKIVKSIKNYADLLTSHIDKEDNILYPMADMHLSPGEQKKLLAQFETIEEEKIGPGKHEQFHRMLENLSQVYEVNSQG